MRLLWRWELLALLLGPPQSAGTLAAADTGRRDPQRRGVECAGDDNDCDDGHLNDQGWELGLHFDEDALFGPGEVEGMEFEGRVDEFEFERDKGFHQHLGEALVEQLRDEHLRVEHAILHLDNHCQDQVETCTSNDAGLAAIQAWVAGDDEDDFVGGGVLAVFRDPLALTHDNLVWSHVVNVSDALVRKGIRFAVTSHPDAISAYCKGDGEDDALVVFKPPLLLKPDGEAGVAMLEARGITAQTLAEHFVPQVMVITYENEDLIDSWGSPVLTLFVKLNRRKTVSLMVSKLHRIAEPLGDTKLMLTMADIGHSSDTLRYFSAEHVCSLSERKRAGFIGVGMRTKRGEYFRLRGEFSEQAVTSFVLDVLEGRRKPEKLPPQLMQAARGE